MKDIDMRLKEKYEIENYEEKSKFLEENGWETWYHDDNWIKTEWWSIPKMSIDRAGCPTDMAYNICKNSKK